jgi:hypothetical protein
MLYSEQAPQHADQMLEGRPAKRRKSRTMAARLVARPTVLARCRRCLFLGRPVDVWLRAGCMHGSGSQFAAPESLSWTGVESRRRIQANSHVLSRFGAGQQLGRCQVPQSESESGPSRAHTTSCLITRLARFTLAGPGIPSHSHFAFPRPCGGGKSHLVSTPHGACGILPGGWGAVIVSSPFSLAAHDFCSLSAHVQPSASVGRRQRPCRAVIWFSGTPSPESGMLSGSARHFLGQSEEIGGSCAVFLAPDLQSRIELSA